MIPNKLDKSPHNTLSAECSPHFPKLAGGFNSHAPPSRAKATLIHTRNRSTSSSLISNPDLPPPGPAHYAARRALWLTPTKVSHRSPPSSSRQRLEHLLNGQGTVNSEEAWRDGIEKVWKGLVNGGRLKRRLPLSLVIKVIHAGWLRDPDTWPPGAVAPDSDQDLVLDQPSPSRPVDMHPFVPAPHHTTSQEEVLPQGKNEISLTGIVAATL